MFDFNQKTRIIGKITVTKRKTGHQVRFSYQGKRHEIIVSSADEIGLIQAIKIAQLINNDIELGKFDETYARYSPIAIFN